MFKVSRGATRRAQCHRDQDSPGPRDRGRYCVEQVDAIIRTDVTSSRWLPLAEPIARALWLPDADGDEALPVVEEPLPVVDDPLPVVDDPPLADVVPLLVLEPDPTPDPLAPEPDDEVLALSVPVTSTWCPACCVPDAIEVVVTDTGIGIDPRLLAHVFERFRQADSRHGREHGGLGLGLAIARQLAEMHGGTITAESDGPGHGSTFRVRLPAVAA